MNTFSERITGLRKQAGLSQEQLGKELNISRQAISKWESGQANPDLSYIGPMCDLFGVSADYLLFGKEEETGAQICPHCGKEFTPAPSSPGLFSGKPAAYALVLPEQDVQMIPYENFIYLFGKSRLLRPEQVDFPPAKEENLTTASVKRYLNSEPRPMPLLLCSGLDKEQMEKAVNCLSDYFLKVNAYEEDKLPETLSKEALEEVEPVLTSDEVLALKNKDESGGGIGFWGVVFAVIVAILILSFF